MTGRPDVEPVGLAEIAERLGVQRVTVDRWRERGVLPDPTWQVGGRPAWDWQVIEAWARATGRLPDQEPTVTDGLSQRGRTRRPSRTEGAGE